MNRFTVVENVYHENEKVGTPTGMVTTFSTAVTSDEQAYKRTFSLPSSWVKVDTGWVETPGFIIVRNESKKGGVDILIGCANSKGDVIDMFILLPGDSWRVRPAQARQWLIKGVTGQVTVTVMAVPE